MKDLDHVYGSDQVSLLAHSQGNVVASEALRLAAEQGLGEVVSHNVSLESAVSADMYLRTVQADEPDGSLEDVVILEDGDGWDTPNIFAHHPATGAPFFAPIKNSAGQVLNFFNIEDNALAWWRINQNAKPDPGLGQSTFRFDGDVSIDPDTELERYFGSPEGPGNQFEEVRSIRRRGTGQPGSGQPSRYETEVVNTFHLEDDGPGDWTDTYFVYAHIAESRSEAVAHVQAADF